MNDGNAANEAPLNTNNEAANRWEAVGVVWASAQSIGTVKFTNGSVSGGHGFFAAGLQVQYSTDGSVWQAMPGGWVLSTAYGYDASVANNTYTFTGPPVSAKGVRIAGQLTLTGITSKFARVREVYAYAAQNASVLGASKVLARPQRQLPPPTVTVTKYYYFGGQRVAMRKNGAVSWLHSDHLGSASVTTNANGNKVAELRYKPFGEVRFSSGALDTNRKFNGNIDDGFGLLDYGARMYSPLLGRFLSADTVVPGAGNPQAFNRYAYALNNPLKYVDPTGHWVDKPGEKPRSKPVAPVFKPCVDGTSNSKNYRVYEFEGYLAGYSKVTHETASFPSAVSPVKIYHEFGVKSETYCFTGNCHPSTTVENNVKFSAQRPLGPGITLQLDNDGEFTQAFTYGLKGVATAEVGGNYAELSKQTSAGQTGAIGITGRATVRVAVPQNEYWNQGQVNDVNIDPLVVSAVQSDYGRNYELTSVENDVPLQYFSSTGFYERTDKFSLFYVARIYTGFK